ncbi:hypothetical protein [Marinobacter sp.]|uniref:hypothetical protein n=1 Tax=Marinobacter sp. TaxID=50741 RepID=UPI003A91B138
MITPKCLWLPITHGLADELAKGASKEVIDDMTTPELAAALVLLKLPSVRVSGPASYEQLLAGAIAVANESVREQGTNPLRAILLRDLDAKLVTLSLTLLDELHIKLMTFEEVQARDYLTPDGEWSGDYCAQRSNITPVNHRRTAADNSRQVVLSSPQARIADALLLNVDEPLHVQGYAGVGKTHLLASLISLLGAKSRPLVLSQTQQQMRAIRARVQGDNIHFLTFQMLALESLDQLASLEPYEYEYSRPTPQRMSGTTQIRDTDLAAYYGFKPLGSLSGPSVANLCRRMIMSFCSGPANAITEATIPAGIRLSASDRALLVMNATILWKGILNPPLELDIPIRAYHLIKLMALKGYRIPPHYSHVVVDESHDLSVPMIQVLERSPQAFITLGDDLQALSGHVIRHSSTVREREIGLSLRAGEAMESVLMPLIQAHPLAPQQRFEGSPDVATSIKHYERLGLPEKPCTVLVKDHWGLFEWFLRLCAEARGTGFELLANRNEFLRFATDLIELHNTGRRGTHGALFRYDTWGKLMVGETAAGNKAFERIARRLERGLSAAEFKALFLRYGADSTTGYRLAMVNDVRNREFDAVMLAPDLLPAPDTVTEGHKGKLLSAIYTGASRARHELILPGYLSDWVSDLKRTT